MRANITLLLKLPFILLLMLLLALATPHPARAAGPIKVILDTDIDSDDDDVSAVAMLHALADRGEVEILAMGVASCCPYSPACLDALNTWHGRGGVPIGVYKGRQLSRDSRYARAVAERCPHDLGLAGTVPGAVEVYRRTLAAQSDGAVTFIAIGEMNNLADLLASPPDRLSPLAGRELVRRKVAVLYAMAPYFNEKNEFQRAPNFSNEPKGAIPFIEGWPTPIRFAEGNLGHRHFIGKRLGETPANNPARIAFEAWSGRAPEDRHCADPTTILYAVRGPQLFGEVGPGACQIRPADGFTRWDAQTDRQHYYNTQKLKKEELERVMNELMLAPPKGKQGGPQ